MKTLVLANQKGGVGKSAIGTQLAFYAVNSGLRVLYIDLDHQQHSTHPIMRSKRATLAPFKASELQTLSTTPPLDGSFVLVPGDANLSNLEGSVEKFEIARRLGILQGITQTAK